MNIVWFKDKKAQDINIGGGKAANLAIMSNLGLPVPPGFIITAYAYKKFLEENSIDEKIYSLLENLDVEDSEKLHEIAERIQNIIIDAEISTEMKQDIEEAYENLNIDIDVFKVAGKKALDIIKAGREMPFVAVRSSATAEDLPQASFAGQQATFLNVKGSEELLKAVQKCWASLFTARAIYYRVKNNFEHRKVYIAVVVQKMVNSDKAGVIFTANPTTNNEKEIVIEAAFGLGESVVSGAVTPDNYIVDKETLKIKDKKVGLQEFSLIKDINIGKTVKHKLTEEEGSMQKLANDEVLKLARYAMQIEEHYEKPQDIEFAIERNKIYIVQSRAITTLKSPYVHEEEVKKEEPEFGVEVKDHVVLEGLGASPYVGSGPVKLIHSLKDLDKIQKGDVAVTHMTNPDYTTTMKKVNGIVTDEGGSTCISGDTKILTKNGFISIKDIYDKINNGDELKVLGLNSKTLKTEWKKIIKVHKRKSISYNLSVFEKRGCKDNFIRITPNHEILTFKNGELIKETVDELIKNKDEICVIDKIPVSNSLKLKPSLAYLSGAIFSDGSLNKIGRKHFINFTQRKIPEKIEFLNHVNNAFFEEFNENMGRYEFNTTYGFSNYNNSSEVPVVRLYASKKQVYNRLHTVKETIQNIILNSGEEFILHFLGGLIDGDGCFNKFRKDRISIAFNKKDINLLEGSIIALLKLGIVPHIYETKTVLNLEIRNNLNKLMRYTSRVKGNAKEIKRFNKIINSDLVMFQVQKCNEEHIDVFNLTVDADEELDHNYIAFTKRYIPVLIGNCHAAIISREMGKPCVVGTLKATQVLKEGDIVTVDGIHGKVYRGEVEISKPQETKKTITEKIETVTEVKVNIDLPEYADEAAATNADGIGLLRCEFMLSETKEHPSYLIKQGRKEELVRILIDHITRIANLFKGKPIWYRTSDFRSDEYGGLKGGEEEPKEDNPMLGWHGIRRSLDQVELLKAEFEAIKKVHDSGFTNVGVMIPMVTSVEEVRKSKEILKEIGLEPLEEIEFGVMLEVPAAIEIIEDICKEGIDFVSFGTNDLTQFTLAVDRNNALVQKLYNEMHPAVLKQIERAMRICKEYNVETSICGQAGSREDMVEWLVKKGIDSVSANIDAVEKIREVVRKAERNLLVSLKKGSISE